MQQIDQIKENVLLPFPKFSNSMQQFSEPLDVAFC